MKLSDYRRKILRKVELEEEKEADLRKNLIRNSIGMNIRWNFDGNSTSVKLQVRKKQESELTCLNCSRKVLTSALALDEALTEPESRGVCGESCEQELCRLVS